jgi:predicted nuclease of restriction endonuclease-like (RecB) superfamily
LGGDFAFIGRQRRLRIGDQWFRVGAFSHADAGQRHMYLNYARERWTLPDEKTLVAELARTRKALEARQSSHPHGAVDI